MRDEKVKQALERLNCKFQTFKDQVIFEGLEIRTSQDSAYQVFTPYKRRWRQSLEESDLEEFNANLKRLTSVHALKHIGDNWRLADLGFKSNSLWLVAGENAAMKRLQQFTKHIEDYQKQRNFPAIDSGTSGISAHLRFGTVSIRQLVRVAKSNPSQGATSWLDELIWREFYHMILDQFPHVIHGSFKSEYDAIEWPGSRSHFKAWCQGRTGFPLVDAAMRLFNKTGWMHNRLRMIVASFLTKDLLVSWQLGEAYFARYLLDFDLAANNGGWQWCASTGCDAQPYFRVFNPITQSKRFDPTGDFIRRNLPELRALPNPYIHEPIKTSPTIQTEAKCIIGRDYPRPIVDHAKQRPIAISLLSRPRSGR